MNDRLTRCSLQSEPKRLFPRKLICSRCSCRQHYLAVQPLELVIFRLWGRRRIVNPFNDVCISRGAPGRPPTPRFYGITRDARPPNKRNSRYTPLNSSLKKEKRKKGNISFVNLHIAETVSSVSISETFDKIQIHTKLASAWLAIFKLRLMKNDL